MVDALNLPPHDLPSIGLDQFLKLLGLVETGGQAKLLIRAGEVQVNGQIETRRGRKLRPGDVVSIDDQEYFVEMDDESA